MVNKNALSYADLKTVSEIGEKITKIFIHIEKVHTFPGAYFEAYYQ
jgi:hypothetical protein